MNFQIILAFAQLHLIYAQALGNIQDRNVNHENLIKIINLLNSKHVKRIGVLNEKNFLDEFQSIAETDKYMKDVGEQLNDDLQNIIRTVQQNYDAYENNEISKSKAEPQIVYISNPEVIERFNENDGLISYDEDLRRRSRKSSMSTSSESYSNEEEDDMRKSLKDFLEEMRKKKSSQGSSEPLLIGRRKQSFLYPRRESVKDYSIEKAVWKEDAKRKIPMKEKDLSYALDTKQYLPKSKNSFGAPKRPAGFQTVPKLKFDNYKPKREFNSYKREDYRAFGRTSIPVKGKRVVYDK